MAMQLQEARDRVRALVDENDALRDESAGLNARVEELDATIAKLTRIGTTASVLTTTGSKGKASQH
jgi:hypothetical protein